MSLLATLFLPILWVLDGHAAPLEPMHVVHGAQFEAPGRTLFLGSAMRREPASSGGVDNVAYRPRGHGATDSRLHARPRSLSDTPSGSSSMSHPLLVGIVIGVAMTSLAFGLAYIFCSVYRRRRVFKARIARPLSIPLRPSAPREFRHLQHITTSQSGLPSPTNTTASSLRVAHRRPDGSWAFTDDVYDRDRDLGPDPTLPVSPTISAPPSPMVFPSSPVSDSSGTAFSYDDASSSKTGPPPYITPALPVPRHESEKSRGHRRRPSGR